MRGLVMCAGVEDNVLVPRALRRMSSALFALALVLAGGHLLACSTAETVALADGGCVGGECRGVGGGSPECPEIAAAECDRDAGVAPSFNQIFNDVLQKAGCANLCCHGAGNPPLMADVDQAYTQIMSTRLNGRPYVVPCDAEASRILCNLVLAEDQGTNEHGSCGTPMPLPTCGGTPLTKADLDAIATWISCGAQRK